MLTNHGRKLMHISRGARDVPGSKFTVRHEGGACTSSVGDSAYDALSDALVLGMCSFLKLVY